MERVDRNVAGPLKFSVKELKREHEYRRFRTEQNIQTETLRAKLDDGSDQFLYIFEEVLMNKLVTGVLFAPLGSIAKSDASWFYTLPPIDLIGRLFGSGLRRSLGVNVLTSDQTIDAPRGMQLSYGRNLLDWFGWFVPGYPMLTATVTAEVSKESAPPRLEATGRSRSLSPDPLDRERIQESIHVLVENERVDFDSSLDGVATLNLRRYFDKLDGDRLSVRLEDPQTGNTYYESSIRRPRVAPSIAAPSSRERRRLAFVVGIDEYVDAPPLKNAVNDAKKVAETLSTEYGFEVFRALYNRDATEQSIQDALDELGGVAREGDSVVIYYSGHGHYDETEERGYWIPVDAKHKTQHFAHEKVRLAISKLSKAQHVLLVSDSCYAEDLFPRERSADDTMRDLYIRVKETGVGPKGENLGSVVESLDARRSRFVLTSGGLEKVADGGRAGHSIFTYYLLESLRHPEETVFTVRDLGDSVRRQMRANSPQNTQLGPLRNVDHRGGEMIFFHDPKRRN
ncbi:MAG: caspase family protein [Planctomycetota bacterium]